MPSNSHNSPDSHASDLEKINTASDYFARGQYHKALEYAREIAGAAGPYQFDGLVFWASALVNLSQDKAAAPIVRDLVTHYPTALNALRVYGEWGLMFVDQALDDNAREALYQRALAPLEQAISTLTTPASLSDLWYLKARLLWDHPDRYKAEEAYRKAIQLNPANSRAYEGLALFLLHCGDFDKGWFAGLAAFEARNPQASGWSQLKALHPDLPPVTENSLEQFKGANCLILAEQGLGDNLLCLRYLPPLQAQTKRLSFYLRKSQKALKPLFEQVLGKENVFLGDAAMPAIDRALCSMSLPYIFGHARENPPASPRVTATAASIERAKRLLAPIDGQAMIGLCISGNRDNLKERDRHITLETLIPALPLDKRYILIQKDLHEGDRAWLDANPERVLFVGDHLHDFMDTAGILTHMAYIITIDSALGHLAGTMNIPTGLLLPYDAAWLWRSPNDAPGEQTPLYKTHRLLRQSRKGDWSSPLEKLQGLLTSPY